ncbi:hypothetical protein BGZ51_004215 [Haplosporangium sp. Z 767]|nr:hypothetical protein BGZ51_004215 [Haplosporangium sp. Z 767]
MDVNGSTVVKTDLHQESEFELEPQSTTTKSQSPLNIPELLQHIVSYLSLQSLTFASRVNRSFYAACTPPIWRSVSLNGMGSETDIWGRDKGFRVGLIRHGPFLLEELHLHSIQIQDGDMELIAENCTKMKVLDLTRTNITAETLQVLIHSDPYNTRGKAGSKRRRLSTDSAQDDADVNTKMARYRELTETETENEPGSQYESVGIEPSTATESEQEQQQQRQPTGPVVSAFAIEDTLYRLGHSKTIPKHRLTGTTRPAKYKGVKTQFPYHLETLILDRCEMLTETCMRVVSLLGPQLKRLSLRYLADLDDTELIELTRHCPNLVELQLEGTSVTNKFFMTFAQELTSPSSGKTPRRPIERLTVNMTSTSNEGLVPFIKACRSRLSYLSFGQNDDVDLEALYAFLEDPNCKDAQRFKVVLHPRMPPVERMLAPNTVLTEIHLRYVSSIPGESLRTLFRFATELRVISMDGCEVNDECLLELATTYRNRMQRLGLGIPMAWREHELAMERVPYHPQHACEQLNAAQFEPQDSTNSTAKIFSGTSVPGGLTCLRLRNCYWVTNRGIRAIVRSCVGLQTLDVGDCVGLSVELFHGPWACTQLVHLDMQGMALQVGSRIRQSFLQQEEDDEKQRFPLSIDAEYRDEDEEYTQGKYDFIVIPLPLLTEYSRVIGSISSSDDDDEDEEDEEDEEDLSHHWEMNVWCNKDGDGSIEDEEDGSIGQGKDDKESQDTMLTSGVPQAKPSRGSSSPLPTNKEVKRRVPRQMYRNTAVQKALLRELYAKLGLLRHLKELRMPFCNFRFRIRDGLDLALPGLQRNLVDLDIIRDIAYTTTEEELIWIGKHFGYGFDYTEDDKERDEQVERSKTCRRVGKLEYVRVDKEALGDVDERVIDWMQDQGIHVHIVYEEW